MKQIKHKHRLIAQNSKTENMLKINQTYTNEQTKKKDIKKASFEEEMEEDEWKDYFAKLK